MVLVGVAYRWLYNDHSRASGGHPVDRKRIGRLGGWISIAVNGSLFAVKAGIAVITGSLALLADAIHTLSDITTSIILLISLRIAAKPGDYKHPFGHGRAEYVATILIATLLAVAGFEMGKYSVERILQPVAIQASWTIISVVLLTIVVKEALARFVMRLSRQAGLPILEADAWHHRADAISSALVVIAMIFARFDYHYLDGWMGLIISLFIFYTAYRISKESMDDLIGTKADNKLLTDVENIALNVEGVQGIHDVVVHSYGHQKIISLHIEVDEDLSLWAAHQISENVDRALKDRLGVYATVHVDPVMKRTPEYRKIETIVQRFCQQHPGCEGYHDLRIIKENNFTNLYLDLVLSSNPASNNEESLILACEEQIRSQLPHIHHIFIKLEPRFTVSRRSRHNEVRG